MPRQPLYEKEEFRNGRRTLDQTRNERDKGWGQLRDYHKGKKVYVAWDFNEDATKDGVVCIMVGRETVYVDVQQLMKYLRWV